MNTFIPSKWRGQYNVVGQEDDADVTAEKISRVQSGRSNLLFHISILLNALLLFLATSGYYIYEARPISYNQALKRVNTPSPFLERFEVDFEDIVVNGSVFNLNHTIFQEPPSPAVDEAWSRISRLKIITVAGEDLNGLGKDPDEAVKVPDEWGYGNDIYPVLLDGQHILHCLNSLRKLSYFSYYFEPKYGPGSNSLNLPLMLRTHHTHCLYMLLQALRCQPSMNVNTFLFQEAEKHPWSDFRTKRRCVNHEAILEWQEQENWMTVDMLDSIKPGLNSKILPAPEELLRAQADDAVRRPEINY